MHYPGLELSFCVTDGKPQARLGSATALSAKDCQRLDKPSCSSHRPQSVEHGRVALVPPTLVSSLCRRALRFMVRQVYLNGAGLRWVRRVLRSALALAQWPMGDVASTQMGLSVSLSLTNLCEATFACSLYLFSFHPSSTSNLHLSPVCIFFFTILFTYYTFFSFSPLSSAAFLAPHQLSFQSPSFRASTLVQRSPSDTTF